MDCQTGEDISLANQMKSLAVSNVNIEEFGHCSVTQEEIHKQIHRQQLIDALKQQEFERTDTTFSRQCLLCKKQFVGNRSSLFQHLMESHHLCIGHPDNIVYVNEYLDVLGDKLKNLECFFCEKRFRDWMVLKEHMRKKQHKRLNPMNPIYDKFFTINYLEPGKKWNDFEGVQEFDMDFDEENCEVELDNNEQQDVICLFCYEKSKEVENNFDHMKEVHSFDFPGAIKEHKLMFYDRIRLINYIRMQVKCLTCPSCTETFATQAELLEHLIVAKHSSCIPSYKLWGDPAIYYFPLIEDDRLITSIDDDQLFDEQNEPVAIIPEDFSFPQNSVLMDEDMRQLLLQEEPKNSH